MSASGGSASGCSGDSIQGLGVNGIIDDKLSVKVCNRMRIGEK